MAGQFGSPPYVRQPLAFGGGEMQSHQEKRDVASIMGAATNTLALYALIVVFVEGGFGLAAFHLSGIPQVVTISGMIFIIVLVVAIAGWRFTSPKESFPREMISLWTEDGIPIPTDFAQSLIRRWNCRWTYRDRSGKLMPYVDDRIEIESVDAATGKISGTGISAYGPEANCRVYSRVSKRRLMHLFYSTAPPKMGLAGMLILRISPLGEMEGWWLGTGRKGGDVAGQINWVRSEKEADFEPRLYPAESG